MTHIGHRNKPRTVSLHFMHRLVHVSMSQEHRQVTVAAIKAPAAVDVMSQRSGISLPGPVVGRPCCFPFAKEVLKERRAAAPFGFSCWCRLMRGGREGGKKEREYK